MKLYLTNLINFFKNNKYYMILFIISNTLFLSSGLMLYNKLMFLKTFGQDTQLISFGGLALLMVYLLHLFIYVFVLFKNNAVKGVKHFMLNKEKIFWYSITVYLKAMLFFGIFMGILFVFGLSVDNLQMQYSLSLLLIFILLFTPFYLHIAGKHIIYIILSKFFTEDKWKASYLKSFRIRWISILDTLFILCAIIVTVIPANSVFIVILKNIIISFVLYIYVYRIIEQFKREK